MSDRSTLQWGGLAGIVGGGLFILVFLLVGVVIGAEPTGPAGPIERFPEIRTARTLENGLYLAVLGLWVLSYLAAYRALAGTSPASALFGSAIGIVSLVVLAVGAVPHAASIPLSDAYRAAGTPDAQDALVVAWHTTQGIFNALLITGLALVPFSLVLLGIAMLRTPAFGSRYGAVTVALSVAGAASAVALLLDPESLLAVIGVFALIVFHIVMGVKLYALSRSGSPGARGIRTEIAAG